MENNTKIGRVRYRNISKSYGFLRCEGKDYFFHMTAFKNEDDFFDAEPGAKLEFIPKKGKEDKDQADELTLIKGR